jgi:hypothetical protein
MNSWGEASSQGAAMTVQGNSARPTTVVFEYFGNTHLTIVGSATHTSYHFDQPGARVLVDGRDRLSLSAVRVLRVVSEFPA